MSAPHPSGAAPAGDAPPSTGLPAVDEALARLAGLDEQPVTDHPEALAAAHEVLHAELQSPSYEP